MRTLVALVHRVQDQPAQVQILGPAVTFLTCLNVRVTLPLAGAHQRVDDHGPGFGGGQPWMHKAERRFTFYMGELQSPAMLRFAISYQDQMGIHQTQTYRLDIPSWPPAEGNHLMATRETFAFVMQTVESLVAERHDSPH